MDEQPTSRSGAPRPRDDVAPRHGPDGTARTGGTAGRREARADGVGVVAAGWDGSAESEEAVRWAASLARRLGSALRVVWAWKVRDVWDTTVATADQVRSPSLAEMEDVARGRLTDVLTRLLGADVEVDVHLRQGPDSAGILLHAASDADLLVVGSRGRGRASSAVLGSVSARCVRESRVPVLVIPHALTSAAPAHAAGHEHALRT
ncbi:MAG TPA: universal stress protein [Actinomycetospora sp.]|nr:universal stress protein [Actinomycetospora sp.]